MQKEVRRFRLRKKIVANAFFSREIPYLFPVEALHGNCSISSQLEHENFQANWVILSKNQ